MSTVWVPELVIMQAAGQIGFVQMSGNDFVRHLAKTVLDEIHLLHACQLMMVSNVTGYHLLTSSSDQARPPPVDVVF